MTKRKLVGAKIAEDLYQKLEKEAKKNQISKSLQVNRIITDYYTGEHQQTFDDIWRTQPKRLYCPQFGWSTFPDILQECQSCNYRTGEAKTKCSMWYRKQGLYNTYHDPPQKIKHRR